MNTYCVYKHTFPNKKVYIGITSQNPLKRWAGGSGYRQQNLVFRAIKKYGWDNVKHEIVFDGLSLREAHEKEIELISLHKSNDRNFGYNVSSGGCSAAGHMVSEEAREKVGAAHRGKPLSAEHKEKLRKAHLGKNLGERPPEVKAKISRSNIGKKQTKPVNQYLKDGTLVRCWGAVLHASNELGISQSNIICVCKGVRQTAGGFVWAYATGGE